MTISLVQAGTAGASTGTTGPTSATLGSPATAGNLLAFSCSCSTGSPNLIGPGTGWVLAGISMDGPPACALYLATAAGGETTASVSATTASGLDCQLYEFDTGGLALRADVAAGLAVVSSTNTPATLSAGPCARSGLALAITVWKGSGSLAGFAVSGWTVDASGQGARGYQTLTAVAGSTTVSVAASWTTARTGEGFVVLLTPAPAHGPVVCMIA